MADFKHFIAKVANGEPLNRQESAEAFNIMMSGDATPSQIGGFLMALRVRGETVSEIAGAVGVMRNKMLKVKAPADAVDIVGTGGDGMKTYNISTLAALIVAGAGVPVAKHGNRALSSASGAADALTALGVKLDIGPEQISRCITEAGIGFMFAQSHHSAMRHVGPSRVELGTRTIYNLLGPLSNPAGVRRQLIGVFAPQWLLPIAEVMKDLGSESVWVVHGEGMDEITTTGSTEVAALEDGKIRTFKLTPADFDVAPAKLEDVRGGNGEENAKALRAVLAGAKNAYRDIALANAAASLVVAGKTSDIAGGMALATESLERGAAASALERLVAVSNS
ncbi:anthranilate phosphoribosyltransferase [Rhizobium sp. L1K21]|uniref:anthranilate phosphoribosyltransferase n=1 Tax=Rhizobium sp. L1K21 TaxID=2954933 RepID=UPI002092CEE7|nr:anthranilate phosphoribosyltransferase [Rhizobium sp. L1K21]MCO6186060.1 anthranilate phosphoribosyltransferase [Rhizobium sp. L1K21]